MAPLPPPLPCRSPFRTPTELRPVQGPSQVLRPQREAGGRPRGEQGRMDAVPERGLGSKGNPKCQLSPPPHGAPSGWARRALRSNALETGLAQSGSRTGRDAGDDLTHTWPPSFWGSEQGKRQEGSTRRCSQSWRRVRSRPPGRVKALSGGGRTVSEMLGPRGLAKARASREVGMDASSVNPPPWAMRKCHGCCDHRETLTS